MKAHSAFTGDSEPRNGNGMGDAADVDEDGEDLIEVQPLPPQRNTSTGLPDGQALTDASTTLLARAGVIEEEDLDADTRRWMEEAGLMPEDFNQSYGLLAPEDAVIIRPYGGEDDDIMLQELRPRFVVMYEPNLAFIRRLEVSLSVPSWQSGKRGEAVVSRLITGQVYKNCNPGLALRVYQMTYTNSFEEDRFLSTMSREAEAFKKLIEDRQVSLLISQIDN